MKKIIPYLILIIVSVTIYLTAFTQEKDEKSGMTVSELKQMQNDSLVILDVRTEEELTGPLGHIDGIVHIPLQELKMRISELDKYTGKKVAVICRSGNRSSTATGFLRQQGFDAHNVEGGMIEYRKKGH
ncbi:MAG: rhodanese-like domain-containing protein [Ignavibacteriaceae bacterium]